LAHRWGVRPHAAAKAHEAPCRISSSIGSAMGSTFIRLVTALFTGGLPVGAATDFGIRQNPADYASKTSFECERISPRAASMRSACNALPRVLAAGLVMPLASPTNFRRSGSKRVPRHVVPLSTGREHGILFARLVSPWRRKPSRNSWPYLQAEDPNTKGERANTLLQPFDPRRVQKPEASGDALPLPPNRARLEPRTTR
jgi:hypothetical protein